MVGSAAVAAAVDEERGFPVVVVQLVVPDAGVYSEYSVEEMVLHVHREFAMIWALSLVLAQEGRQKSAPDDSSSAVEPGQQPSSHVTEQKIDVAKLA